MGLDRRFGRLMARTTKCHGLFEVPTSGSGASGSEQDGCRICWDQNANETQSKHGNLMGNPVNPLQMGYGGVCIVDIC